GLDGCRGPGACKSGAPVHDRAGNDRASARPTFRAYVLSDRVARGSRRAGNALWSPGVRRPEARIAVIGPDRMIASQREGGRRAASTLYATADHETGLPAPSVTLPGVDRRRHHDPFSPPERRPIPDRRIDFPVVEDESLDLGSVARRRPKTDRTYP